jgi:hypothetical protein
MPQADQERLIDDYIMDVLRRRRDTKTDVYDVITMVCIDTKWGREVPWLPSNSGNCHAHLRASINRLRRRGLVMVEISQNGSHRFLLLTNPLEQFTRQVHES